MSLWCFGLNHCLDLLSISFICAFSIACESCVVPMWAAPWVMVSHQSSDRIILWAAGTPPYFSLCLLPIFPSGGLLFWVCLARHVAMWYDCTSRIAAGLFHSRIRRIFGIYRLWGKKDQCYIIYTARVWSSPTQVDGASAVHCRRSENRLL